MAGRPSEAARPFQAPGMGADPFMDRMVLVVMELHCASTAEKLAALDWAPRMDTLSAA